MPITGESSGEVDPITISYSASGLMPGLHTGTITVSSGDAVNSPQMLTVNVTVKSVKPDFDEDLDVDLQDFGHLQWCLSGVNVPQDESVCQDARLDGDTDVDGDDILIFLGCMTGADIPVDMTCDD